MRRASSAALRLWAGAALVLAAVPLQAASPSPAVAAQLATDGRIAFTGTLERPERDLYTMLPNGTDVTRLTTEPGGAAAADPAWSPDGSRLSFSSTRGGDADLYSMDPDGSSVTRITNEPGDDTAPAWSPDGTSIAFARADPDTPGSSDIYRAAANGDDPVALTSGDTLDTDPAWSPDGTQIAFVRDGVLWTMAADGSAQAAVAAAPAQASAPSWSPNGTKIAFAALAGSRSDVYVIGSTGTGLVKLTGSSIAGAEPHWSPDGSRIVFEGRTSAGTSIATMLAGGSCPVHVRSAPAGASVGAPAWQALASAPLSVSSSPDCVTVQRGSSATFTIGLSWAGGAMPNIALDVEGLPSNTTARFGPNPAWRPVSTLTISTAECGSATPLGTRLLTITAWNGPVVRTTTVALRVVDGPPRATGPVSQLYAASTLGSETTPVRTSWSACNNGPVGWYKVARLVGTTWGQVSSGSATSISQSLATWSNQRYRAQGGDSAFPSGGAWANGPTFMPRIAQETGSGVTFAGTWSRSTISSASGGGTRFATAAGASVTYSFVGSSIGWVSYRDSKRGSAQVYIDGKLIRTVNLQSNKVLARRIVFAHSWPTQGRHTIKIVVMGTVGHPRVDVDAFVLLSQTPGFIKNTYNGHFATERPENITCVSASALTWSNYTWGITHDSYYSHEIAMDWYREVRSSTQDFHNRYDYTGIEPGLDPRGWAWLLWEHAPPGRGYHDYWSSSQNAVNSWMVWNILNANEPAGALTFRSVHAVDVVGFSSDVDPRQGTYTLNGFFIVDPWYPNGPSRMGDGGTIGVAPNTYLTLAAWNRSYLLPYVDKPYEAVRGPNLWHGKYVAVLRSVNGTPEPSKFDDSMPPTFSGVGPSAAAPSRMLAAEEPAFALDDALGAVTSGIAANNLEADARVGLEAGAVQVGRRVDVDSLSPDIPPYSLVEVVQRGRVVAIAMLTRDADGLRFAGIQGAWEGNALVDPAEARRSFRGAGIDVRALRAVWRPSADSMAPFSPFWAATDAAGRQRFLTPGGSVKASLQLPTPR